MAQAGFIRDKLEIKFLILYVAARLVEPVPFPDMQDLCMCDGGIDFFDFSECLNDLVKTEHLRLDADERYAITEKGVKNSAICESSLPYTVRMNVEKRLAVLNQALRRRSQVKASVSPRPNGTYTVSLALADEIGADILHLDLMAPTAEMAHGLEQRFIREAESIYGEIINVLFNEKTK